MELILILLRMLFGRPRGGSARLMPVAVRPDGRTHTFRGKGWLGNWLAACEEWLRQCFGRTGPRRPRGRWGLAPGGADGPRRDE